MASPLEAEEEELTSPNVSQFHLRRPSVDDTGKQSLKFTPGVVPAKTYIQRGENRNGHTNGEEDDEPKKNKSISTKPPLSRNANKSLYGKYMDSLKTHPVTTKVLTGCFVGIIGDVLCQFIFPDKWHTAPYGVHIHLPLLRDDWGLELARTMRSLVWAGVAVYGNHYWYDFLNSYIKGSNNLAIAKKVSMDQVLWAPLMVIGFFIVQGVLKHGSLILSLQEAQNNFAATIAVNWVYWTIMQTLNFKLIPEQLNVLFINIAGIFWTIYLSFVANSAE
eukprot:gb/GECG01015954.1/.p1 GENE.gb/GECG01015954.1/~~gb/GECG01015954.1/.p1  ORF type:complete len:276 (+),score=24.02 gb/GECG01015954.1/:1-828(+)